MPLGILLSSAVTVVLVINSAFNVMNNYAIKSLKILYSM
jgi:hypothetical protein